MKQSIRRGFFLHASSVIVQNRAVAFLGHTSSGKSTICRILSEQFPILSDDVIYVFRNRKSYFALDGEFRSGDPALTFDLIENGVPPTPIYPLSAAIRIYKSKMNRMIRLEDYQLCKSLIDAVFEVDIQRRITDVNSRKAFFSSVADLSRRISGWSLHFRRDSGIIKLLRLNLMPGASAVLSFDRSCYDQQKEN